MNNCNTYLINAKHPILIDTGLSMCLNGVLEDIKKDGIDPEAIEFIISTHSHPDHFDGVKHFMQKDTKMALHPDEDTFLKETGKGFYNMFGLQMPDYRVDSFLQEGELKVNTTVMEIYHTPGHSPGSVSIYLPDSQKIKGWGRRFSLESFPAEHCRYLIGFTGVNHPKYLLFQPG